MSIADKLIYLNGTKEKLKDSINNIGGSITDETTFRNYATELDTIYDNLPKTTGEGSNLSLNTLKGRINVDDILGDTTQEGTPTPSSPQDINVVTGTQEVVVQNKNLCDGQFRQGGWHDSSGPTRLFTTQNLVVEKGKTYTISTTLDTTQYKYGVVIGKLPYPQTTNPNIYDSGWSTTSSKTITFNVSGYDIGYLGITIATANETDNLTPSDIEGVEWQVEYGSNATTKVEHQEQTKALHLGDIELCKIGNYQDYLYKSNGKWYKKEQIAKYTFTGNENWVIFGAINYEYQINYTEKASGEIENQFYPAISNLLINHNVVSTGLNNYEFSNFVSGNYKWFRVRYNEKTSLADFTAWLGTNNLIVYTNLATPQDIEITNETLIEELNELEKMMSYSGQTNISVSGNLPMILEVTALKGE